MQGVAKIRLAPNILGVFWGDFPTLPPVLGVAINFLIPLMSGVEGCAVFLLAFGVFKILLTPR